MYTKLRREFGRHPVLQDEPAEVSHARSPNTCATP